jgi:hypothetical protein
MHWIDSNVFISSKNSWYGFDIVPAFWTFLEQQASLGVIKSPMAVHKELCDQEDELSTWAKTQRETMFIDPDEPVQREYSAIVNHVSRTYKGPDSVRFLARADPWVIAHAKAENGIVVTLEARVGDDSKKVKIPNICEHFGVSYVTLWEMLRSLGASF